MWAFAKGKKVFVPFRLLRSNNMFYVSARHTNYAIYEALVRTLNNINNIVNINFSLALSDFKMAFILKEVIIKFVGL